MWYRIHSEILKCNFTDSAARATSMGTVQSVKSDQVIFTEESKSTSKKINRQSGMLTIYNDKGISMYVYIYKSKL